MNMSSLFIGNTLAFFLFRDDDEVKKDTKQALATVLIIFSGVGSLLILGFRPTPWADKTEKVSMIETLKVSRGN